MPDNETNNNSLVPIHNTGLIKVGNIIKITDKVLKEYSERALDVFYKSVIIGEQEWMVKNLYVDHFRNGDTIPEAKTDEEWKIAGKEQIPVWCYYVDNNPEYAKKYGKLYNWYAVNDSRCLAPEGWRIPSDSEWTILTEFLGGYVIAGKKMKTISDWGGIEGTNESGFTALPGGVRFDGACMEIGRTGDWWSSTEVDENHALNRLLSSRDNEIDWRNHSKSNGAYVRCIKNNF